MTGGVVSFSGQPPPSRRSLAGMEGALPSVVGGLVGVPLVAVPTSVGYGASFGGLAALLGMLNSCAPGVTVVNIDNGYGAGVFAGLPNPFIATRYHSLIVRADSVPEEFEVTARTESGIVMGMRHRELPVEGVQFHPESVLTDGGHRMLANWMASAGHPVAEHLVAELETGMRRVAAAAHR